MFCPSLYVASRSFRFSFCAFKRLAKSNQERHRGLAILVSFRFDLLAVFDVLCFYELFPTEAYIVGGALSGLGGVGITKIIEELVDSEVGLTVKANVTEKIQETLDQYTALLRVAHPGSRLFTLTTGQNGVIAMLCPFYAGCWLRTISGKDEKIS